MKDTKSVSSKQADDQHRTNGANEADSRPVQEETASSEAPETPNTSAQSETDAAAEVKTEIKEAEDKAAEYLDQLMRSQAELQNYKKRTEREMAQIRSYANEHFATELLAIKDSLETGLQNDTSEDEKKLYEGLELTLKLLQQAFEKFGIREINPEGEPFNPEFHEAMMTQADARKPPNTVLKVLQKGYLMNDRLLRAARVCVSSTPETLSPPKAEDAVKEVTEREAKNEASTAKNVKNKENST